MALQKTISLANNFGESSVFKNSYIKVSRFNGTKERLVFDASFRKTSTSMELSKTVYEINYNLDGENPIKQAYLYLKTLPEFADAVDC
jgi:hypothetical protein